MPHIQCLAIVGMQWGDEGKGKIVDYYAQHFDYIVRYAGGDNAGHTVKVGKETFKLHLIPSGVLYPEKVKVIGNGVVLNPVTLFKEIGDLEERGYRVENLVVSDRTHIIMPYHLLLDELKESRRRDYSIGTTGRGIGPAYEDKVGRSESLRVVDLLNKDQLREKLGQIYKSKKHRGLKLDVPIEETINTYIRYGQRLRKYIKNTAYILNQVLKDGKTILLEGAQGALLDLDHGTYPYVTSSNPTIGGAGTGTGIPPQRIDHVIGIVKAYTTRVGRGPFPTELGDEILIKEEDRKEKIIESDFEKANKGDEYYQGKILRKQGGEYGTTTGRPRRCGWLDTIALKYAAMINGINGIALTKLDVLSGLKEIKICTAYSIHGRKIDKFPSSLNDLRDTKPIYKVFKGWHKLDKQTWHAIAKREKPLLPNMKTYLNTITKEIGKPIYLVSIGPEREATLDLSNIFLLNKG